MLKKIGRWVAGRTQGSKGVEKYDDFMRRNPWAGIGLDVAGAVGGGLAGGALLGKVGGIKGLLGIGRGAQAASSLGAATANAPGLMGAAPNAVANLFTPAASTAGRVGGFVAKNRGLIGGAAKTGAAILGQQAERAQNADQMAIQRERLALDRERFGVERDEIERERERRERVARLLMPLFQQQLRDLNLPQG